jgi:PAS domain S-box-containing protein
MRLRTTVVVLATTLLLSGIVWLVAGNYDRAIEAAAEQRAARQRAMARTIAVGLEVDLEARIAALRQLGAIPSVQQVDEVFLPSRLDQGLSSRDPRVGAEIIRGTPDGRTLSWRPGMDTLAAGAVMAAEVWAWARSASSSDEAKAFVQPDDGETRASLDLVIPIFHTATSPNFPTATGAYLGWLATRVDLASLAVSFFDPVLEGMSDTALAIISIEGARLLRQRPLRGTHAAAAEAFWPSSSDHWAEIEGHRDGARLLDTPGGRRIVAWATVDVAGLPLLVQADAPIEVAIAPVRATFLHQLLPFALLSLALVAFAWMYLRSEQTEQRYRDLVEQAADGVFVLDLQGRIVEMNSAAAAMLERPSPDALGRAFVEVLDPGDAAEWDAAFSHLGEGQRASHAWRLRVDADRVVPAEVNLSRGSGRRILAVARDTSRRLHLEEQLRQSQKVEAIGRLAGGIAHDFNNLLTAIIGYTELIIDRLGHDPTGRADALEVKKSARRAATLTRQLLAFGRKQMLRPQVIDLNQVLVDIGGLLERLIGDHVDFAFAPAPDLWAVEADPNQLEQVVVNLALNARDAMPGGGRLSMSTANVNVDGSPAWPSGLTPGDYVLLTVADTGHGIDAAHLPHLFEPFFTTRPVGQGTGLGLPMVHGILTQSGGGIDVESSPGHGATFRVLLPRTLKPRRQEVNVDSAPRVRQGHETLLLVEDDDSVRALARDALVRFGYTVIEAATPGQARALSDRRAIDAVVSDVAMPQMSGPELVAELRRSRPGLRALFISGYSEATEGSPASVPAGAPFVAKPFTTEELAGAVGRLFDRRAPHPPDAGTTPDPP